MKNIIFRRVNMGFILLKLIGFVILISSCKKTHEVSEDKILISYKFTDLPDILLKSKSDHKKSLLFFSNLADVNCRKMKTEILSNNDVQEVLTNNYYFYEFFIYRDIADSISLSNNGLNAISINFQIQNFGTNYQPYFVILDYGGNIINSSTFINSNDQFIQFLTSGLGN